MANTLAYTAGYRWGTADFAQVAVPPERMCAAWADWYATEAHRQALESGLGAEFACGAYDATRMWLEASDR